MTEVVEAVPTEHDPLGGGEGTAIARRLAETAIDKGGTDLVAIEIGRVVAYTDLLLICTARNERMASTIADEARYRLKQELRALPRGADGAAATGWQVMDYGDCVMHIFTAEARDRYQLEDLWREAPRVDLEDLGIHSRGA